MSIHKYLNTVLLNLECCCRASDLTSIEDTGLPCFLIWSDFVRLIISRPYKILGYCAFKFGVVLSGQGWIQELPVQGY